MQHSSENSTRENSTRENSLQVIPRYLISSGQVSADQFMARYATSTDIRVIYELGTSTDEFKVSDQLIFYSKSELLEWVKDRRENVLMVLEKNGLVVGFTFCKIMSHRWALTETLYIHPDHRTLKSAEVLYMTALNELKSRGIEQISFVIRDDHRALIRLLKHKGSADDCGKYTWLNMNV
jgi:N-acetylglutamate synthase-like GNAT family acetyltransferase